MKLFSLIFAFDTVNHEILLNNLEYFGFDYTAIAFFHSYLSNRKQQCKVNGASPELLDISCRLPQGTILGPLLFLMYIDDLPTCLKSCTARRYANDTRLTISCAQFHGIEGLMSTDVRLVLTWLIVNKLSLNVLKSEFTIDLSVKGISLSRVEHTKCLGVHIDENRTWAEHVSNLAKHRHAVRTEPMTFCSAIR